MTPAFALKRKPDAAFESLYRRHVHEVYRYALAVLGNPSDAEDVTQTTFMNAYRAVQAGERPRKPGAWLRTIAHNVCRQRFRQASRRPREVVALDELRAPDVQEEPDGPSAEDIKRALQSLPFNQRSAIVMRELEGRRQAEIAAALGLSESAVEALLFRARRAMREQLEASITCGEAERAVSRQLDRSLPAAERRRLRAHLRECDECAGFARQARAQRGALKSLGAVPLPASLLSWSGAGSSLGGLALGAKVVAGVAAVAVAVGAGDLGIRAIESGHGTSARAAGAVGGPGATPGQTAGSRAVAGQHVGAGNAAAGGSRPGAGAHGTKTRGRSGTRAHGVAGRSGPHGAHGSPSSARGNGAANGSPSTGGGNGVRAHGNPPAGRGNGTRAHGSPSGANGVRAHGSPSSGRGNGVRAHGTPSRSHGTAVGGSGPGVRAHGAPAGQHQQNSAEPPPGKRGQQHDASPKRP